MINRSQTTKPMPLNIAGSSSFGRYPKISQEITQNMFLSDGWLVPYAGYKIGISASLFQNAIEGRAIHSSIKLNRLVVVFDSAVYLVSLSFNQMTQTVDADEITPIGNLGTSTGPVYISENNKPQLLFSDNSTLYLYDPTLSPYMQVSPLVMKPNFIPGRIDFHDTYFLCAVSADAEYMPTVNNTWRLSSGNDGSAWPADSAHLNVLQTKPDNTQAVVRVPGQGNLIFVMGRTVTEMWFDVGAQLFPYQRNSNINIDFGCLNALTIASLDEIVAWLGVNEKSGPIILYSKGGAPNQITTDGIDYFLSNMQAPEDSQAFMYRQDGHLFYHINFYTDNVSLFYDFNTGKFFHASDENGDYFIASSIAFFNNQYYFISRNNGNLYAFDTIFTTFDGAEIPRTRVCKNIRNENQEYFIANDCGFTIESGQTNYQQQITGPIYLNTVSGNQLVTQGGPIFLTTQNGNFLVSQNGNNLTAIQQDSNTFSYLITNQQNISYGVPRIDMSISIDGGEHFSSYDTQYLPSLGHRKNKLAFWQLGATNDLTCQFRFWSLGRFVATDGVVNIRQ